MMVKQHMLFTLYSICGIVLKGKSASNFRQPIQWFRNSAKRELFAQRSVYVNDVEPVLSLRTV